MGIADSAPVALVTEDDGLIGMDLCDFLEQAGYRVVGPLGRLSDALRALGRENPAVAVLDVMLADGSCAALADELRRRGVPFLVHSGCQRADPFAAAFQGVPWLPKPSAPSAIARALDALRHAQLVPCSA
jgi:DNA-binding response OmpR family regulator